MQQAAWADDTSTFSHNFQKKSEIWWIYLESPWEMYSNKFKHAWYWFRNLWTFEYFGDKNWMDGKTNGRVQSINCGHFCGLLFYSWLPGVELHHCYFEQKETNQPPLVFSSRIINNSKGWKNAKFPWNMVKHCAKNVILYYTFSEIFVRKRQKYFPSKLHNFPGAS